MIMYGHRAGKGSIFYMFSGGRGFFSYYFDLVLCTYYVSLSQAELTQTGMP